MGSIVTGFMGGGSSPGQDAQMQAVKQGGHDYQNYRQHAMQARLNMLGSAMLPFQGANNMLETLWGDPNRKVAKPFPEWGGTRHPQTPMGQQAQMQQPQQSDDGSGFNFLDPLNIFGKGGPF